MILKLLAKSLLSQKWKREKEKERGVGVGERLLILFVFLLGFKQANSTPICLHNCGLNNTFDRGARPCSKRVAFNAHMSQVSFYVRASLKTHSEMQQIMDIKNDQMRIKQN